ncbi:glutaconate CoA-transferase, subunit A [Thermoflexales bacterium]|nr:glutaconate CoA-transferase, subunit A [Thermoflexales bacterium]
MIDKTTSLTEAAKLIKSGATLSLGGMNLYRRPVALVRELLKTEVRDLTLLNFTSSYESDLLIGAGRVKTLRTCYCGLESFGLAPMFTTLATAGKLQLIEETEASIAFGLRATLAGVGFMPGQGWIGTDLLKVRPDVKVIDDPYTGQPVVAFPAQQVDVAIIHAPIADRFGNARLLGNLAIDQELSLAAKCVIVTAEEIVDELDAPLEMTGLSVTAVVPTPRGAWPTSCYPHYPLDGEEILRYIDACAAEKFEEYIAASTR